MESKEVRVHVGNDQAMPTKMCGADGGYLRGNPTTFIALEMPMKQVVLAVQPFP